jgi:hypothetical protein
MINVAKLSIVFALISLPRGAPAQINMAFPGQPTTVENFVTELSTKSHTPGSLIIQGECISNQEVVAPLPDPPAGPFRNLNQALTLLQRTDTHLAWSREGDGFFRITDKRVPTDILEIQLKPFQFNKSSDVFLAVAELLQAPEVERYFTEHAIQHGFVYRHLFSPLPSDKPPNLSDIQSGLTLREALDTIAKFYQGAWIYDECSDGHVRRVTIRATPVGFPMSR